MISRDKYYRGKYDKDPLAPPRNYPGRSKITIHEDTDGDGKYDLHKTFAKGLDLANSVLPAVSYTHLTLQTILLV